VHCLTTGTGEDGIILRNVRRIRGCTNARSEYIPMDSSLEPQLAKEPSPPPPHLPSVDAMDTHDHDIEAHPGMSSTMREALRIQAEAQVAASSKTRTRKERKATHSVTVRSPLYITFPSQHCTEPSCRMDSILPAEVC
jgi:hypothetical protein